jgi:molybdopterin-guanine dinucleotide biosynthesis protein A
MRPPSIGIILTSGRSRRRGVAKASLPAMRRRLDSRRPRNAALFEEVRVRYVEGAALNALDSDGSSLFNSNTRKISRGP